MIYQIDIHIDRTNYIVHLKNEDEVFWIVPMEDDGSDKWDKVQEWLDEGNKITDTLEYKTLYRGERAQEYPDIKEQLDMQYHDAVDGTTTWKDAIQAIKDAHPKP
jgi:hypothetical protein